MTEYKTVEANSRGEIDVPDGTVVQLGGKSGVKWVPYNADDAFPITVEGKFPKGSTDSFDVDTGPDGRAKFASYCTYVIIKEENALEINGQVIEVAETYPGRVVRDLPKGSWVIEIMNDKPFGDPFKIGDRVPLGFDRYAILSLGKVEPAKAGELVSRGDADKLKALPVESLIVDNDYDVITRTNASYGVNGFNMNISYPARVLRVGKG